MADYNTGVPSAHMQGKLKKFDNIITVAKTGYGDYVCTDPAYATDSACIQAALNHISTLGGGTLYLQGHFICPTQLLYTGSNLTIIGDDANTVLDFSAVASNISCLYIHGAITATNSAVTTADALEGALTVTVADGTKFSTGDWVRIRSEGILITYAADVYGDPVLKRMGEIQKIKSINGNILTFYELLHGDYTLSDTATVDKMTMVENITLKDFKMVGNPAQYQYGINVEQCHRLKIKNVQSVDMVDRATHVVDCVWFRWYDNYVIGSNRTGLGYGCHIQNSSRDVICKRNGGIDCRHLIACGGNADYGVQYVQNWSDNILEYDSKTVGMFGPHPTYKGLTLANNHAVECSLGFANGLDTIVTGNTATSFAIPSAVDGMIFSENIIDSIADHCLTIRSQKGHIKIFNNKFTCSAADCDGINAAYQIKNLVIENNEVNVAGIGINCSTYSGLMGSENVSIKNNKVTCTGTEPGITVTSTTYDIVGVTVEDNTVISAADGIMFTCYNNNITRAIVENNNVTVPATATGISMDSTGTGLYAQSSVSENTVYGSLDGIKLTHCTYIDAVHNRVFGAAQYGLSILTGCIYYNVMDNDLATCATPLYRTAGVTGRLLINNRGYNPVGSFTAPSVPASGDGTTGQVVNNYGYPCEVCVHGGTVTAIYISETATGLTTGTFTIEPLQNIALTYSAAPTWTWRGL
jgi:hypothetical protein